MPDSAGVPSRRHMFFPRSGQKKKRCPDAINRYPAVRLGRILSGRALPAAIDTRSFSP